MILDAGKLGIALASKLSRELFNVPLSKSLALVEPNDDLAIKEAVPSVPIWITLTAPGLAPCNCILSLIFNVSFIFTLLPDTLNFSTVPTLYM